MAANVHTGLILVTGVDKPGIAETLFTGLAPFSIDIIDIEQIVIRNRFILTVLIKLDPAHAKAIESDLTDLAIKNNIDIAVDFTEIQNEEKFSAVEAKRILVFSEKLHPKAIAKVVENINGNVLRINRLSNYPVTIVELLFTGVFSKPSSDTEVDILELPYSKNLTARKLIVLDVDSTLIEQEVIDLLAAEAGVGEEVSRITESAMRGDIDFVESLQKRVALLRGLPETAIAKVHSAITLSPGAKTLIDALHDSGHAVGIVSGGFSSIVEKLASELGINHFRANNLEIVDGKLTGKLLGEIIDRAAKAQALKDFAEKENIPLNATVAIGDGANDLDMLEISGLGVAYRAKPAVAAAADFSLKTKYLDSLLYVL
ncbi:MAG: hypothetical protein RL448_412 [Actinomycetota bacterium]